MRQSCVAFCLALALASTACSSDAQTFEPFNFEAEVTLSIEAEKGEILVPENRSNPDSRTIPIRFVRLASRAERPGSPIVYLAGGPGAAATRAMRGQRWVLFDRLRDVSDVIILDQRGTGLSDSVPECDSSIELPGDRPPTEAVYVDLHRRALSECLDFWEAEGVDIRGYTTRESAADIDAVRKAVGADRLSLLGISYGTHLALAMLSRYPDHVDRLVLVSAEGLDHTVKLPSHTEAYFERLQAAIDSQPDARAAYPDVRGLIENVLDHVEKNPTTYLIDDSPEFHHTISRFELQLITGYALSDPEEAASILEGYLDAIEDDFLWFRRYFDWSVGDNRISFNGMSEIMDLASGISARRLARVAAESQDALLGNALNFPMPHLADAVDGVDLGPGFREPVTSDRPTLFFSGTLDGRTYPEAHAEVAAGFSNGALVTVRNAGHNLFFSHPEVVGTIAEFFGGAPPLPRTLVAALPRFAPD